MKLSKKILIMLARMVAAIFVFGGVIALGIGALNGLEKLVGLWPVAILVAAPLLAFIGFMCWPDEDGKEEKK